jgi:DinB superfamily
MNKLQIADKLRENHQKFADYISTLSEQDFMFLVNEKWTAGQQLDHILRGVSPVKMALSLPKFVPKILFGKPNRSSISYENLVASYQGKLALGGKASGRFIPPKVSFDKREVLKNKLLKTVTELCKKLDNFSETQLDELILPHPIIGKLTIREMLYFTIYHCDHHHKIVIKNLKLAT